MAITTTLQKGMTVDYTSIGENITEVWIGDETDIATLASTYPQGATYTNSDNLSGVVKSSKTEKIESDCAKWTVNYFHNKAPSSGQGEDDPLDDIWAENCAQYQYPLEKYLDKYEAKALAAWKQEDPDTQLDWIEEGINKLPGKSLDVAKLMFAGTYNVQRSYPQVTRVRIFRRLQTSISPELNTVDSTPDSQFHWDETMSWLKVGFDWVQDTADNWTLTETWIGTPESDGGWNTDLYKDWPFYYEEESPGNDGDNNNEGE